MKHHKFAAILLVCLLGLSMLISFSFLALEADHEHTPNPEHCTICLQIEICMQTLKQFGIGFTILTMGTAIQIRLKQIKNLCCITLQNDSLISLKVKLTI